MILTLILAFGLLGPAYAKPAELPTPGPVVNIVEWDGNALPPVYERSYQLPISQTDLIKLSNHDFGAEQLALMISQRRYAGDVSAEGLIALREAGLHHDVVQAASLHALPPNRGINLMITLEIDGLQSTPRSRYLYIIIPDGEIERVFTADLEQILGRKWKSETVVDRSDLLIPRSVRAITFNGRIPLKTPGQRELTVFTSTRPDIHWLSDISGQRTGNIKTHAFEYPASSIKSECRLLIRLFQDRVLEDNWNVTGTHLECEWN